MEGQNEKVMLRIEVFEIFKNEWDAVKDTFELYDNIIDILTSKKVKCFS